MMITFILLLSCAFHCTAGQRSISMTDGIIILEETGRITCLIRPSAAAGTIDFVRWEQVQSDGTRIAPIYVYWPDTLLKDPQRHLVNRSDYQHFTNGSSILIIKGVQEIDQGNYTCLVDFKGPREQNTSGIYTVSRPGLDVTTYPPGFDNIIEVKNGTNVTFSAVSNCSKPPLELEWSKPGAQNNPRQCNITSFPGYGIIESSLIYQATANTSITLTARHPTFPEYQSTTYVIAVESDDDACKNNPCKNSAPCTTNDGKPSCTCVKGFRGPICQVCLYDGEIAGIVIGYVAGYILIVCLIVFAVKLQFLSDGQFAGIVIGCLVGVALFIGLTVFALNRQCLYGGQIAGFVIGCLAGCVLIVCLIVIAVKKKMKKSDDTTDSKPGERESIKAKGTHGSNQEGKNSRNEVRRPSTGSTSKVYPAVPVSPGQGRPLPPITSASSIKVEKTDTPRALPELPPNTRQLEPIDLNQEGETKKKKKKKKKKHVEDVDVEEGSYGYNSPDLEQRNKYYDQ